MTSKRVPFGRVLQQAEHAQKAHARRIEKALTLGERYGESRKDMLDEFTITGMLRLPYVAYEELFKTEEGAPDDLR